MRLVDYGRSRMRQVLFPNIHLMKVDSAVSLDNIGCGLWRRSGRDHDRIERQDGSGAADRAGGSPLAEAKLGNGRAERY